MSGKGGRGTTSKKGLAKSEGDDVTVSTTWLPATLLRYVKDIIGDKKYTNLMQDVSSAQSESEILLLINKYLSHALDTKTGNVSNDKVKRYHKILDESSLELESDEEESDEERVQLVEKFATKLTIKSPVTTVVVAFARNSRNQPHYRSQVFRVVAESFPTYEEHEKGNDTYILYPCGITGKFISVSKQGHSRKYVQHYNTLYDTVQSLVKGGKKVIVTMLDIDRLHRDPTVALDLADDLEALGREVGDVQVKPMRTFDYSIVDVLDTAIKIADEAAEQAEGDDKAATSKDAARGLRDEVEDDDKKKQKAIDDTYDRYIEKKGKSNAINLEKSTLIKEACINGDEIVREFVYLKSVHDPILAELRDGVSDAEAKQMVKDYIKGIKQSTGKQNIRVSFQRSSDRSKYEQRNTIIINNTKHPEQQLLKNVIYLEKNDEEVQLVPELISRSDYESDGDGKQSSASVAIISVNAKRRQHVIKEVLAIVEKIAKKEVHSLLVTITTRLSGYGGYIRFIKELCDQTGTEFIMTECIGIGHIDIADEEDERVKALETSLPKLINEKFAPNTDMGRAMLKAANESAPQDEDKTEWNEMKTKKKARTKEKAPPPKKNKNKKAPPPKKKAIPIDISVGKKPPPNEVAPSGKKKKKKKGKPEVTPATKKKTSKKYDDDSDDMDFEAEEERDDSDDDSTSAKPYRSRAARAAAKRSMSSSDEEVVVAKKGKSNSKPAAAKRSMSSSDEEVVVAKKGKSNSKPAAAKRSMSSSDEEVVVAKKKSRTSKRSIVDSDDEMDEDSDDVGDKKKNAMVYAQSDTEDDGLEDSDEDMDTPKKKKKSKAAKGKVKTAKKKKKSKSKKKGLNGYEDDGFIV